MILWRNFCTLYYQSTGSFGHEEQPFNNTQTHVQQSCKSIRCNGTSTGIRVHQRHLQMGNFTTTKSGIFLNSCSNSFIIVKLGTKLRIVRLQWCEQGLGSKGQAQDKGLGMSRSVAERRPKLTMITKWWWRWWIRYLSNKKVVILTDNPSSKRVLSSTTSEVSNDLGSR